MIRPALMLGLWLALAAFVALTLVLGDTLVAERLGPRAAAWCKALVPLPYVLWLAALHARRTAGPQALVAGACAGALWAVSTALLDIAFNRALYGESVERLLDRYALFDGAPTPLLLLAILLAPPLASLVAKAMRPS